MDACQHFARTSREEQLGRKAQPPPQVVHVTRREVVAHVSTEPAFAHGTFRLRAQLHGPDGHVRRGGHIGRPLPADARHRRQQRLQRQRDRLDLEVAVLAMLVDLVALRRAMP